MWAPHVTAADSSAVVMAPSSAINDLQPQKQKQPLIIDGNNEILTPNCNEVALIADNVNRSVNFANNQNVSIPAQETIVDVSTAAEDLQQLIDEMSIYYYYLKYLY